MHFETGDAPPRRDVSVLENYKKPFDTRLFKGKRECQGQSSRFPKDIVASTIS
jgi:hypothetical protein